MRICAKLRVLEYVATGCDILDYMYKLCHSLLRIIAKISAKIYHSSRMDLRKDKAFVPIIAMSLGNAYYSNPNVLLNMAYWIKQQDKVCEMVKSIVR